MSQLSGLLFHHCRAEDLVGIKLINMLFNPSHFCGGTLPQKQNNADFSFLKTTTSDKVM